MAQTAAQAPARAITANSRGENRVGGTIAVEYLQSQSFEGKYKPFKKIYLLHYLINLLQSFIQEVSSMHIIRVPAAAIHCDEI